MSPVNIDNQYISAVQMMHLRQAQVEHLTRKRYSIDDDHLYLI